MSALARSLRRRLRRFSRNDGPDPVHLASERQRAELRREARDYVHNLLLGPTSSAAAFNGDALAHYPLLQETITGKPVTGVWRPARNFGRVVARYSEEHKPLRPRARCRSLTVNLAMVSDLLGFDEVDRCVLRFLIVATAIGEVQSLIDFCSDTSERVWVHIAITCNLPVSEVRRSMGPEGRLRASGLVVVEGEPDVFSRRFGLLRGFAELALSAGLDRERLLASFLPEAPPATLVESDFAGLAPQLELAARLLERACASRTPGVHLLLYGPTGTGKTEASRLIARAAGLRLYAAGLDPSRLGDEREEGPPTSRQRLSSLLLGQKLFSPGSAAILFDEFEDLFASDWEAPNRSGRLSKLWFNRFLETSPIPLLWATNSTSGIDPAFLRRFSFAIEFAQPGPVQRARVLRRHLGQGGPADAEVNAIAQRFNTAPAQLGSAVATARLISGRHPPDRETLERLLAPLEKLVFGREPSPATCAEDGSYDLSVVRASEDLAVLATRAAALGCKADANLSLLLHGAPGTGKSEYARHLALRMGRPLVVRRVSDLESPLVGVAEQQIAQAFAEAQADKALLLFDEVDSFLSDRAQAVRSWETTRVNEFLQQLEAFRGVVVCTTNQLDRLDPAALRRFALKIEFRPLDAAGAERLFRGRLGPLLSAPLLEASTAGLAARLADLPPLTAGDFGAVERRLRALGEHPTLEQATSLLEGEARLRKGPARRAGF